MFIAAIAIWPVDKAQNAEDESHYCMAAHFTFHSKQKRSKADGNPTLQSQATNPLLFFSPPDQQLQ